MSVTTPQHHRVGAHRARRNPVAVTAIGVGATVALSSLLVWGLFATGVLGGDSDTQALGDVASAPATPGIAVVESMPSVAPVAPPASVAAPPVVTTPAAPVADLAASVTVLNGGVTVSGVARGLADSLVAAGWTGVDVEATANAPGDVPATLVAYADPALQVTAEAMAVQIGQGTATLSTDYSSAGYLTQLVVVLGADFVPPA